MAIVHGSIDTQGAAETSSASKALLIERVAGIDHPDIDTVVSQLSMLGRGKTPYVMYQSAFSTSPGETELTAPSFVCEHQVYSPAGGNFTAIVNKGKRLVILGMSLSIRNTGAAVAGCIARLRVRLNYVRDSEIARNITNPGLIANSIPLFSIGCGTDAAVANVCSSAKMMASSDWPGLIELPPGQGWGIGIDGTTGIAIAIIVWGYEY